MLSVSVQGLLAILCLAAPIAGALVGGWPAQASEYLIHTAPEGAPSELVLLGWGLSYWHNIAIAQVRTLVPKN